MKLVKAMRNFYLSHVITSLISIFLMGTLWSLASRSGMGFSAITALIYVIVIYSVGWNCGDRDGRRIPGFYPDPKFPFLLAGLGAIVPVLLLAVRFLFPGLWSVNLPFITGETEFLLAGNHLQGTMDFIYKLWYFPFLAFMGNGDFWRYLLPIVLQSVLIIIAYFVGTTRFRIMDFITRKLVFTKKKK